MSQTVNTMIYVQPESNLRTTFFFSGTQFTAFKMNTNYRGLNLPSIKKITLKIKNLNFDLRSLRKSLTQNRFIKEIIHCFF